MNTSSTIPHSKIADVSEKLFLCLAEDPEQINESDLVDMVYECSNLELIEATDFVKEFLKAYKLVYDSIPDWDGGESILVRKVNAA